MTDDDWSSATQVAGHRGMSVETRVLFLGARALHIYIYTKPARPKMQPTNKGQGALNLLEVISAIPQNSSSNYKLCSITEKQHGIP